MSQSKVKELLKPLSTLAQIDYFSYGINFKDNRNFSLYSHGDFYESWFNTDFPWYSLSLGNGWHFMDPQLSASQIECINSFNLKNILCHIQHHEGETVFFEFGTDLNSKAAISFYMNNSNLLKKFVQFVINEMKVNNQAAYQGSRDIPCVQPQNISAYPMTLHIADKGFVDNLHYPLKALSEKEKEVYQLLLHGYTFVEIAELLGISPKTVNVYMTRMKVKLNCQTKYELVKKAEGSHLIEYHL